MEKAKTPRCPKCGGRHLEKLSDLYRYYQCKEAVTSFFNDNFHHSWEQLRDDMGMGVVAPTQTYVYRTLTLQEVSPLQEPKFQLPRWIMVLIFLTTQIIVTMFVTLLMEQYSLFRIFLLISCAMSLLSFSMFLKVLQEFQERMRKYRFEKEVWGRKVLCDDCGEIFVGQV